MKLERLRRNCMRVALCCMKLCSILQKASLKNYYSYLLHKTAIFQKIIDFFFCDHIEWIFLSITSGVQHQNTVQKSTPREAKNFRDFHSQMQCLLIKLHFPNEKKRQLFAGAFVTGNLFWCRGEPEERRQMVLGKAPFAPLMSGPPHWENFGKWNGGRKVARAFLMLTQSTVKSFPSRAVCVVKFIYLLLWLS